MCSFSISWVRGSSNLLYHLWVLTFSLWRRKTVWCTYVLIIDVLIRRWWRIVTPYLELMILWQDSRCHSVFNIDLMFSYNHLRIRAIEKSKTVFRIQYGPNEFPLMSSKLTNDPLDLMDLMMCLCKLYLYFSIIMNIYFILLYSRSTSDHEKHLKIMLHTLRHNPLYINFWTFEIWFEFIKFLWNVVSNYGIIVYLVNIEAICDWVVPTMVTNVRSFVLLGYYRIFVQVIWTIETSLNELTHLDIPLSIWAVWVKHLNLKKLFTTTLILTLQVEGQGFTLYCESSTVGFDCLLMQWQG